MPLELNHIGSVTISTARPIMIDGTSKPRDGELHHHRPGDELHRRCRHDRRGDAGSTGRQADAFARRRTSLRSWRVPPTAKRTLSKRAQGTRRTPLLNLFQYAARRRTSGCAALAV